MQRFWNKVKKTPTCWEWTACTNKPGYGIFQIGSYKRSKTCLAHRFSWQLTHGYIDKNLYILHKCDNPKCVRPDHLFTGTQKDNMADSNQKGRHPRNATGYLPTGKNHHFYEKGIKITREIANQIRATHGIQKDIAKQFHVDPSLVSLIKNNRIWKI